MQVPAGIIVRTTKSGHVKYCVRVYDPSTGGQRWVGTYGVLRDAIAAKARETGPSAGSAAMKVREYYDLWKTSHARPEASTMERYESSLRPFVTAFGHRYLHTLRRPEALEWSVGQPLGVTDATRAILNDAKDDGLLTFNPFEKLGRRRSRGRKDLEVISTAELSYLQETAELVWPGRIGVTMSSMIAWAAATAMRPAEMFALQWPWIDFVEREVAVVAQRGKKGKLKGLKNNDQRMVALLPGTELVKRLPRVIDEPTVFLTARGTPFSESKLHYYWDPIRNHFGRPSMAFYELRHFCATLLLEAGASPFDVSIHLGHRDGGKLVMDTYGHPSEEQARQRIKGLDLTRGIRAARSAGFRFGQAS